MTPRLWTIAGSIGAALIAVLASSIWLFGGEEAPRFAGRWTVQYNDLSLGLVTGTARVSPDERSVQVVMVHPADKREYRLQSKSIERMRDGLRIVLSGASPPAKRRIYHEIAQPIDLTAGMSELQASLGNTKLRVPIIKPSAPDTDEVTIDLEWAGRDTLSGIWSFRALADTGRDARMGGRTGALALNSDGSGLATVSHSEIWFRPRTYIERVFVIQDQTSVYEGKAAWAYPLDEQGRQTGTALIDRTRTLLVLGRNLPSEHTDLPEFASPDPLIDYRVRAVAVDLKTGQYDAELQRVWDRLAGESVPQAQIDRLRAMEMMLVTAHVEDRGLQPDKRILPGLKALSIDGALGEWLLEYGDFVAALRVVRPLLKAGTFEPITHAFRPERIQFEIEAVRELPYDEIPLLVAVNGHIRTFDGEREVTARRVAGKRKLYRTAEILIEDRKAPPAAQNLWRLPADIGDQVGAALAVPGLVRFVPAMAQVGVVAAPADIARFTIGPDATPHLAWHDALTKARECACARPRTLLPGSRMVADLLCAQGAMFYADTDPDDTAKNLWNLIVFTSGDHVREVPITVGEHAMMLMLRSVFDELMRVQEQNFSQVAADPNLVAGFRSAFEPNLYKRHPLEGLQVALPDGRKIHFGGTFNREFLEKDYGLRGHAREQWVQDVTRRAITDYLAEMRAAREHAAGVDACDVENLLDLTATGFAPVAAALNPRLMFYDPVQKLWRPDPMPRRRLAGLAGKAAKVFQQRAEASADNQRILAVLSLATSIGAPFGGVGLVIFAGAIDVTDFGYTTFSELSQQWAERKELIFARGAVAALGTQRLDQAQERDQFLILSLFQIGISALGVAQNVADPLMRWVDKGSIEAGHKLAADIAPPDGGAGGAAELAQRVTTELAVPQRAELAAALIESRRLAREIGIQGMTTAERRSLKLAEELTKTQEFPRTEKAPWAARLSDSLYAEVAPIAAVRSDVPRLFTEDAMQMGRNLNRADGRLMLRGTPFLEVDHFTQLLARARNHRPSPPGFLETCDRSNRDPAGLFVREFILLRDEVHLIATRGTAAGEDIAQVKMTRGTDYRVAQEMFIMDLALMTPHARPTRPGFDPVEALADVNGAANRTDLSMVRTGVDMVPGKGTPTILYLTLRAFLSLGYTYADRGLKMVKLQTVLNAETRAQFLWLLRTYPNENVDTLFQNTDLFRFARNVLEPAGFEITGVNVAVNTRRPGLPKTAANLDEPVHRAPIGGAIREGSVWYNSKEAPEHFLRRHGLDPRDQAESAFDVYLTVRPVTQH